MKMGQSVAMLLFTGVSAIGAAVLRGIGSIVFAFYDERKVLNRLDG